MKNFSKKVTKESSIQTAISKALTENGWFVVKIMMASKNGIPDLMAIKNGRTIFIEVKNEIGRLSKIQEYRIKEMQQHGAEVIVARSKEEIKPYLD